MGNSHDNTVNTCNEYEKFFLVGQSFSVVNQFNSSIFLIVWHVLLEIHNTLDYLWVGLNFSSLLSLLSLSLLIITSKTQTVWVVP